MTPSEDGAVIAQRLLARLQDAVAKRDTAGSVSLFTDEPSVILTGSEAGERAVGQEALTRFFAHLYARPVSFSWDWPNPPEARWHGDVLWFLAEGFVVEHTADADRRLPYRFSGVALSQEGSWKLALLHGSEPAAPKR